MRIKITITAMSVILIIILLSGCGQQIKETTVLDDFRDIQGVTAEEIAAVEEALADRDKLIWGAVISPEAYLNDTQISGFAPLFCEHLSELFDIEVEIEIGYFDDIHEKLIKGMVDLSADFSNIQERDSNYFMTSDMGERILHIYSTVGRKHLEKEVEDRVIKYLLVRNSNAANLVADVINPKDTITYVSGTAEAIPLLLSGEADAIILDDVSMVRFEPYPEIMIEKFNPLTFYSTSVATGQEELRPIIAVLEKYLNSENASYISQMYEIGLDEYHNYDFCSKLSQEEQEYIAEHPTIAVSVKSNHYPVAFYNSYNGEVEGMAIDILTEISKLTGLTFDISKEDVPAQLYLNLPAESERQGNYLRADKSFGEYRYVFLSTNKKPLIEYSQVQYKQIGAVAGSEYEDAYRRWFPNYNNLTTFEDTEAALYALKDGQIDSLLTAETALRYATHYLKMSGFKVNHYFDMDAMNYFHFASDEQLLQSIVSKAQTTIDTQMILRDWDNQTYDYERDMLKRTVLIISVSLILVAILAVLLAIAFWKNRRLAQRDELTRLPNRRMFYQKAKEIMRNNMNEQLSIWFADIDNFKKINDTYGHDFGDEVLIACANVFRNNSNPKESPYRYGGEEFVAIMQKKTKEQAIIETERILEGVRKIRFDKYPELRVTISMGLCTVRITDQVTLEHMITSADAAMYEAKKAGKNQIIVV